MSARHFLKNHWPSITIAMTATVIAYDGLAVAGHPQRKNKKAPLPGGPYNLIALVFSEGFFGQRVVGFGLNSVLGAR